MSRRQHTSINLIFKLGDKRTHDHTIDSIAVATASYLVYGMINSKFDIDSVIKKFISSKCFDLEYELIYTSS